MPRSRQRVCLEHGLKVDINKLARQGFIRPGAARGAHAWRWTRSATGEVVATAVITSNMTGPEEGWMQIRLGEVEQWITLRAKPRHCGGRQWYFECPATHRLCSVLWRPPGATRFCSRYAWGRQVAYASQFESPFDRANRGKARINMRVNPDFSDPYEWILPPKPKWMRWSTYKRFEERFDRYEQILDNYLIGLMDLLEALEGKPG